MFVGHYAGAFLARSLDRKLPLAAAFVGVQLVDFGWDLFVLAGVEHARLVPGLPSNPLDLYFMPYSHSLAATVVWAVLAGLLVKLTRAFGGSNRVAAVTALAVASHWFLDLLVHRSDLPLVGDSSTKLGLGLWNHPALGLVVEVGVLAASAAFYVYRTERTRTQARWIGAFVLGLAAVQIATVVGPLPPSIPAMTCSLLVAYVAFAWLAGVVDRRASRPTA